MRLERERQREEILAELSGEAERTWGAERAQELGPAIEALAGALGRLAAAPPEMLEAEPAFIGPSAGGEG
jgi:hypothetical protein